MLKLGQEFKEEIKKGLQTEVKENNGWDEYQNLNGKKIYRLRYVVPNKIVLAGDTGKNIYTYTLPSGISNPYTVKCFPVQNIRGLVITMHPSRIIQVKNTDSASQTMNAGSIFDLELEEM